MIFKNQLLISELQNLNIDIEHVAYAELNTRWHREEHVTTNNMFLLIIEGEADIWCNGEHFHMTPGNVYFLPKGARRAYQCPQFLNKLYFYVNLRNSSGEELPITPNKAVVLYDRKETIERMTELFGKNDYHSAMELRMHIEQIIMEIYGMFPSDTTIHYHSPLINNVLGMITRAPHMSMTAEVLAKQTLSSVSLLRQRFKKEVGISIGKFVQEQVLLAASVDLRSSDLTLPEISAKYGFCDQFYFSRLFTAHFGISPSKYRKEHIL